MNFNSRFQMERDPIHALKHHQCILHFEPFPVKTNHCQTLRAKALSRLEDKLTMIFALFAVRKCRDIRAVPQKLRLRRGSRSKNLSVARLGRYTENIN